MKVRLRVQDIETRELGEDIIEEGPDYAPAFSAAKAQIPAGFIINAILVDH